MNQSPDRVLYKECYDNFFQKLERSANESEFSIRIGDQIHVKVWGQKWDPLPWIINNLVSISKTSIPFFLVFAQRYHLSSHILLSFANEDCFSLYPILPSKRNDSFPRERYFCYACWSIISKERRDKKQNPDFSVWGMSKQKFYFPQDPAYINL